MEQSQLPLEWIEKYEKYKSIPTIKHEFPMKNCTVPSIEAFVKKNI